MYKDSDDGIHVKAAGKSDLIQGLVHVRPVQKLGG